MRVLIVEDDPLLGAGLQTGLCQDGYRADWVHSADPAEHALRSSTSMSCCSTSGCPDAMVSRCCALCAATGSICRFWF